MFLTLCIFNNVYNCTLYIVVKQGLSWVVSVFILFLSKLALAVKTCQASVIFSRKYQKMWKEWCQRICGELQLGDKNESVPRLEALQGKSCK